MYALPENQHVRFNLPDTSGHNTDRSTPEADLGDLQRNVLG
jgi:hypothetical protein